jgi:hypothetical protein
LQFSKYVPSIFHAIGSSFQKAHLSLYSPVVFRSSPPSSALICTPEHINTHRPSDYNGAVVIPLDTAVRRRQRLGGIVNEYQRAA